MHMYCKKIIKIKINKNKNNNNNNNNNNKNNNNNNNNNNKDNEDEDNCRFSHDVTKIQTTRLLILLIFYLNEVEEQLKTNLYANFCSEWVLGLAIDYA